MGCENRGLANHPVQVVRWMCGKRLPISIFRKKERGSRPDDSIPKQALPTGPGASHPCFERYPHGLSPSYQHNLSVNRLVCSDPLGAKSLNEAPELFFIPERNLYHSPCATHFQPGHHSQETVYGICNIIDNLMVKGCAGTTGGRPRALRQAPYFRFHLAHRESFADHPSSQLQLLAFVRQP